MPIDYALLRIIWWLLLGVLITGFAIMDGFDLGAMLLLPFVTKNDLERQTVISSVVSTWEGNQVWLILGAGAVFAAWPLVYAISFSSFYWAMMLVLAALILRPCAFKYRDKVADKKWRKSADTALFISGFIPTLVLGIALGNILQGIPFNLDVELRSSYTGHWWNLFNGFALLCGMISLILLAMHGALFVAVKTEGIIRQRCIAIARGAAMSFIVLFAIAGWWIAHGVPGYLVTSAIIPDAPSYPLHKTVIQQVGVWLSNYHNYPWLWLIPGSAFLAAAIVFLTAKLSDKFAFVYSSVTLGATIATFGVSMFPFILPSSSNPSASLLVWDSSSSQITLFIMLVATVIFMPIILLYTAWVYRVLKGKVKLAQ